MQTRQGRFSVQACASHFTLFYKHDKVTVAIFIYNPSVFKEEKAVKNELIWGYMLYLSNHMWADETSKPDWYYPTSNANVYQDVINTEIETWDAMVPFLAERQYNLVLIDVGDGVQYESHPEVSAPNAWSKDFLRQKLNEMRAVGLEPIPKLNFSTCHDTWMKKYRRMISTPEYYAFCADVIREVCEVFDYPRFFHLGCDEESASMQKNYEMIIVRNADLWWHDFYFLCNECEKHGARPWIWSDYLWKNEELFLKNMPKSVLQSNWFYPQFRDWSNTATPHRDRCIACYELLDQHGYDQIPTGSTWNCVQNLYQTVAHGKQKLSLGLLKGFMTAPWMSTRAEDYYALCADADRLYYARKYLYPETLK